MCCIIDLIRTRATPACKAPRPLGSGSAARVRLGGGRNSRLPWAIERHYFTSCRDDQAGRPDAFDPRDRPFRSCPPAADGWRRSLTPQQRAEFAALHRPTAWTQAKPLILLAIWLACAAVAVPVDSIFVRVLCWIVIGGVLHCFGAFVHDCSHLSVFRKPWLDRTLGFLCGLPVFFPSASYRATHQLHHKYLNTAKDPDALAANFPTRACVPQSSMAGSSSARRSIA